MDPFETLMEEHRVIEQVLSCLEKMTDEFEAKKTIDAAVATDALEFIRNFADKCHHGKEEDRLFPALEKKEHFPRGCGPTEVMRAEHEHGRTLVRGMSDAIADAKPNKSLAVERFARNARRYVALLREHIHKEDNCLFPNARMSLKEGEGEALSQAFEKVEHEEMGAGTHEKFLSLANSLADRYGVPRVQAKVEGCCHHEKKH
jgi:hemerythrin-like domain-containing protein